MTRRWRVASPPRVGAVGIGVRSACPASRSVADRAATARLDPQPAVPCSVPASSIVTIQAFAGSRVSSGTSSKRSTSTRPRSVSFRLGITDSARNASSWNGASTVQPSSRAASTQRAARARRPPRAARRRAGRRPAAAARRRTSRAVDRDDPAAEVREPAHRERHRRVAHRRRRRRCARRARPSTRARRAAGRSRARSRARSGRSRGAARSRRSSRGRAPGRRPPRRRATVGSSTSDSVTIWPGTSPITRARPPAPRDAEHLRRRARRRARSAAPSRAPRARGISPTGRARLEHDVAARSARGRAAAAGRPGSRARPRRGARARARCAGLSVAQTSASSGGIPAATASRTIELMWPSSAMCSGSRSSVQNAIRCGPYSASSGSSACRLRAAEASRISSHIPARSRSRPSSSV